MSHPMGASYFGDWPADDYPEAVRECLAALRSYVPRRNLDRSYRASARNALEQARYLGLTEIGPIPPTVRGPAPLAARPVQGVLL